jgi:3-deoxy-D-manno-octulosonic acid kinase
LSDTVEKTSNGAILYDTAIVNQMSERRFTARGWQDVKTVSGKLNSSGRGETLIVSDNKIEFVLRHYMRGGFVRHFVKDVYLWQGEEQTRSFAEWRLLHKMFQMGLPVPRPVAARYRRDGMFYTADLLTTRIPGIVPLSERLRSAVDDAFWLRLGAGLQRFHAAGVCHADLNAYNVQIGRRDALWLLDFDRGAILRPGPWQQQNLGRLHRSLRKIRHLDTALKWRESDWQLLLDGYFQASRSA